MTSLRQSLVTWESSSIFMLFSVSGCEQVSESENFLWNLGVMKRSDFFIVVPIYQYYACQYTKLINSNQFSILAFIGYFKYMIFSKVLSNIAVFQHSFFTFQFIQPQTQGRNGVQILRIQLNNRWIVASLNFYKLYLNTHRSLDSMTQQYIHMLQDLQTTKRELASIRKKYSTIQSDNTVLKDNQQTTKRTMNNLKDSVSALQAQNDMLRKQNQKLIQQYQNDIAAIKSEVDRKQESIRELEMIGQGHNLNNTLLRKQIECEVEARFIEDIDKKDNKFKQLQSKYDALKREKQLEKDKNQLKIKSLETSLQEAQARHIQEVKEYADRLYQQSLKKTINSDESMMKRLRKELDCLRNLLCEKDNQINTLMNEKTHLIQQKGNAVQGEQKNKQQLMQKLADYKRNLQRVKSQQNLALDRQQNQQIRSYERQAKKYKQQIDTLQDQLHKKQVQIQQLKYKQKQLTQQIQRVESKKTQAVNSKTEQIMYENRQLQQKLREINQQCKFYKQKYNNVVNYGQDVQYVSDINNRNTNINERISSNINRRDDVNDQIYNTNTRNINKNRTDTNTNTRNTDIRNEQNRNVSDTKHVDIRNQQSNISQNINKRDNRNQRNQRNQENMTTTNVNKKNIVNQTNIVEERNIKNIRKVYNEDIDQDQVQKQYNKKTRTKKAHRDTEENEENIEQKQMAEKAERQNSPIMGLKVERQREKVRQIARKYIELQKKYEKCKKKLDEANQKVLELLRNKIAMNSPPKTAVGLFTNSHGKLDPETTDFNKRGFGSDKVNSTGNNFFRSASPKNNKYYEKSLSFKSKNKTKELKCLNHDHTFDEECQQ